MKKLSVRSQFIVVIVTRRMWGRQEEILGLDSKDIELKQKAGKLSPEVNTHHSYGVEQISSDGSYR